MCVCALVYNILDSYGKQINRLQQKAAFERRSAKQKKVKKTNWKNHF